uniref:Uncharacterized protein n=1 Tax=Oryza glumipatula TaxID=40148 RepID=A0A0D9Z6W1_9ORYZ
MGSTSSAKMFRDGRNQGRPKRPIDAEGKVVAAAWVRLTCIGNVEWITGDGYRYRWCLWDPMHKEQRLPNLINNVMIRKQSTYIIFSRWQSIPEEALELQQQKKTEKMRLHRDKQDVYLLEQVGTAQYIRMNEKQDRHELHFIAT